MTRINCVPVSTLADQHLLAEYREITRVSTLARKLKPGEEVPRYTMGEGHVKFFYDKGAYLRKRCNDLWHECKARGFNVATKIYPYHEEGLHGDWTPDTLDLEVNIARIQQKLDEKPDFYKWTPRQRNL